MEPVKSEATQPVIVNYNRNPQGKGGFGEHPEHANPGGRPKYGESFVWWYRKFKNMTRKEFDIWEQRNPPKFRTMAADLAYRRVYNSKDDLKEFQEVANRSEGTPTQHLDLTSKGKELNKPLEQIANSIQDFLTNNNERDPDTSTDTKESEANTSNT